MKGVFDFTERERVDALSATIATAPQNMWMERFQKADIAAAICENIEAIRAATARRADGSPAAERGNYSF